jgi:hypothetical protein
MPRRDELLRDVRRMADELDRTPRVVDVLHASEYTREAFRAEWNSWRAVVRDALGRQSVEIPRAEVLCRVIELHETVEQDPSIQTWSDETLYTPRAVYEDAGFDSWTDAKESVGIVIWHRTMTREFDG